MICFNKPICFNKLKSWIFKPNKCEEKQKENQHCFLDMFIDSHLVDPELFDKLFEIYVNEKHYQMVMKKCSLEKVKSLFNKDVYVKFNKHGCCIYDDVKGQLGNQTSFCLKMIEHVSTYLEASESVDYYNDFITQECENSCLNDDFNDLLTQKYSNIDEPHIIEGDINWYEGKVDYNFEICEYSFNPDILEGEKFYNCNTEETFIQTNNGLCRYINNIYNNT